MDKIKFIPVIAPTNNEEGIYFYLRLDQVIAIAYANDPKYKDNYFMIITDYNDMGDEYFEPFYYEPFYYAHKDVVHKCFDLEEMPAKEVKPINNGCGFDEASNYDIYMNG